MKSGTIKWDGIMVKRRVKGKDMQPDFNKLVCPHDSICGTVHDGCSSNAGTACTNVSEGCDRMYISQTSCH